MNLSVNIKSQFLQESSEAEQNNNLYILSSLQSPRATAKTWQSQRLHVDSKSI